MPSAHSLSPTWQRRRSETANGHFFVVAPLPKALDTILPSFPSILLRKHNADRQRRHASKPATGARICGAHDHLFF
jgi:hypothetical protein